MISGPGVEPRLVADPVSIMDVPDTLAELAEIPGEEFRQGTNGSSLLPEMNGQSGGRPVHIEYSAEASIAPLVGVRSRSLKFIHSEVDPPMLFDLSRDPHELTNLAGMPEHAEAQGRLADLVAEKWDLQEFDSAVRRSQAQRLFVYEALRNGHYFPWDYQPLQKASERYMRNHMNLNAVESRNRFPREHDG